MHVRFLGGESADTLGNDPTGIHIYYDMRKVLRCNMQIALRKKRPHARMTHKNSQAKCFSA